MSARAQVTYIYIYIYSDAECSLPHCCMAADAAEETQLIIAIISVCMYLHFQLHVCGGAMHAA